MPKYRRARTPGGTYFFTIVTFRRRGFLTTPECRGMLREAINAVRRQYPFTADAWVLLPDHIHCMWTLPPGDTDYSKRWGMIKAGFSKRARDFLHRDAWLNDSRARRRETTEKTGTDLFFR